MTDPSLSRLKACGSVVVAGARGHVTASGRLRRARQQPRPRVLHGGTRAAASSVLCPQLQGPLLWQPRCGPRDGTGLWEGRGRQARFVSGVSPSHAWTLVPTMWLASGSPSQQLQLVAVWGHVDGLTVFFFLLNLQPENLQKNWLREFYQVRNARGHVLRGWAAPAGRSWSSRTWPLSVPPAALHGPGLTGRHISVPQAPAAAPTPGRVQGTGQRNGHY